MAAVISVYLNELSTIDDILYQATEAERCFLRQASFLLQIMFRNIDSDSMFWLFTDIAVLAQYNGDYPRMHVPCKMKKQERVLSARAGSGSR